MLRVCASQQIPYEDVPVVASRQDDPGVKRVRLQDEDLGLVALRTAFRLFSGFRGGPYVTAEACGGEIHSALYYRDKQSAEHNYFEDM